MDLPREWGSGNNWGCSDKHLDNTYRKNLRWLHFCDELRVQARQQVKDQQTCISVSAVYLTCPSSILEHPPRHDNRIPCKVVWLIYRAKEQPYRKETVEQIKAPIFLEILLAMKIIKEAQSNLEEKEDPIILQGDFSLRIDQFIFTSIETNY